MVIQTLLKKVDHSVMDNMDNVYFHNKQKVPRVTQVLSSMFHEEYLMQWANNIGIYRRANYITERDKAAFIGTLSHDNIEKYISNGSYSLNDLNLDKLTHKKVSNAVESFIKWFSDISNNQIKILGVEQKLTCPWFGGTYDMLIEINNKVYLTDFKTSNHISYKYFLQLSAYYYMMQLNNQKIDGFIILQVDKNKIAYEEYILELDKPESKQFMDLCTETYLSAVYAYYNRLQVEEQFNRLFGGR